MSRTTFFKRRRPGQPARPLRTILQLEVLEDRFLLSSGFQLGPLVQVSGPSPFADCTVDNFGLPPNLETEPRVAVNPTNPDNIAVTWTQDASRGSVVGVSFNGGHSWRSVVVPGLTLCSGGTTYKRAGDTWLSFAPNGDLYHSDLAFIQVPVYRSAVLVSKSTDGGLTWGAPITLIQDTDPTFVNDKDAITADPTDSRFAYVVWDRVANGFKAPAWFSRTTDGGSSWQPPRPIFDPGGNDVTFGNQILVLPDGTLTDFFTIVPFSSSNQDMPLVLIRSSDKGQTWQPDQKPIQVASIQSITVTDPETGQTVAPRPILGRVPLADFAIDRASGNLYAVWPDARFSGGQYNSIAFSMSTDGGFTWSAPIRINQTPNNIPVGNRQAFIPSVAVAADGTVAVTYYDFRNNTPAPGLPTDYWMVHAHPSSPGGLTNSANWTSENRLTNQSFDMETALFGGTPSEFFVGDYEGLAAAGNSFDAVFTMPHTNPDGTIDHDSIFFRDPPPAEATAAINSAPGLVAAQVMSPTPGSLGLGNRATADAALLRLLAQDERPGNAGNVIALDGEWSGPKLARLDVASLDRLFSAIAPADGTSAFVQAKLLAMESAGNEGDDVEGLDAVPVDGASDAWVTGKMEL